MGACMANGNEGHLSYVKSPQSRLPYGTGTISASLRDVAPGGGSEPTRRTSYQTTAYAKPNTPSTPGKILDIHEHYSFVRKLEDTHFGSVWEGYNLRHSARERRVAVKESKRESAMTKRHCRSRKSVPEDVEMEIRIHNSLMEDRMCPSSIIKLLEVLHTEDNIFMVMEFGDGGSLLDFLQKQEFPVHTDRRPNDRHRRWKADVRRWFRDLCKAVSFLHARNICHKDLSLQNILLKTERNGTRDVKIVDFGLAEVFRGDRYRKCITSAKVGKSNFASAECYSAKVTSFDAKSNDCWCLAVILFMCLTQCSPYENPLDDNARNLHRGAKQIRRTLQRWRKSHLVDELELDLLSKMFQNENARYNIEEILAHPYVSDVWKNGRRVVHSEEQHLRGSRL